MARLVFISGPNEGRVFELGERSILGRSADCQIFINDLSVSREHACVVRTEDGFVVEDMGSGNGTYVNDTRVIHHQLRGGDILKIGDIQLRYLAKDQEPQRWVSMATVVAEQEEELIHGGAATPLGPFELPKDLSLDSMRDHLLRSNRMLEALLAVANAMGSVLDPSRLFTKILDYLFELFPDADRGFMLLLDEQSQVVPAAIRRREGDGFSGSLTVDQAVVGRVLEEGQGRLSLVGSDPAVGRKGQSAMSAPLVVQGNTIGVLHIEGREQGSPFSSEDLAVLSGVALQAGVAYHNAFMHQRLLRQQRLEQDLRFARQVQRSFLPTEAPAPAGYRFGRSYNPVFQVGGDFYDFIPLPDERIGVLIADVSGKGVSAALLMARLTSDLRYYAIAERSPAAVLAHTNTALINRMQDNMFATVLYLVLDLKAHRITLSNAGHIPPLLRRAANGEVQELDDATNLALGVLPDAIYDEMAVDLEPDDGILLCTDGVVEARSKAGDEFGFEHLARTMTTAPPARLLDTVLKEIRRFTRSAPQYDDITMVYFTRTE